MGVDLEGKGTSEAPGFYMEGGFFDLGCSDSFTPTYKFRQSNVYDMWN
jgi:hypothetical protein